MTLIPFISASRRAQDQAHPAQRQRAAQHRYPARHHRLPLRPAHQPGPQGQDRALHRRRAAGGHQLRRRAPHLLRAAQPARRGPGPPGDRQAGSGDRAARTWPSGLTLVDKLKSANGHGAHRAGGQVRAAAGRLPERRRGARPRRHPPRPQPGDHLGGRRDAARRRRSPPGSSRPTASWCPAASASAASRARSWPRATPARTRCPTSASAWACRWPWPSSPATWPAWSGANSSEFDPSTELPGHRPAARAEGRRRHGRHHAPGRLALQAGAGHQGLRGLRRGGHLRAPPPPLRGQQRLPQPAC